MFTQKFIKIFHSVQEIGLFALFQNLSLGNASANPKWHLTISLATSCQYQCVCQILSKYSKRFKSYRHFSRTGRRQNFQNLSGDKIKCLIIGHSMKFIFVSVDFLRVVQFLSISSYRPAVRLAAWPQAPCVAIGDRSIGTNDKQYSLMAAYHWLPPPKA